MQKVHSVVDIRTALINFTCLFSFLLQDPEALRKPDLSDSQEDLRQQIIPLPTGESKNASIVLISEVFHIVSSFQLFSAYRRTKIWQKQRVFWDHVERSLDEQKEHIHWFNFWRDVCGHLRLTSEAEASLFSRLCRTLTFFLTSLFYLYLLPHQALIL